jgi:hypothetical protein
MQERKHAFRDRCNGICGLLLKHEVWPQIKQKTIDNARQKMIRRRNFPNSEHRNKSLKKQKIKIRT